MIPDLKNEWWLAKRVFGKELITVFYGITDSTITRQRMREAILDRNIQDEIVPRAKGASFAAAFERLYGERLEKQENAA